MIRHLVLVLGDQLSPGLSSLDGFDPAQDRVLMLEVKAEGEYVPHHPQKIALILSAMRHFAAELQAQGFTVDYMKLDDAQNTQSFSDEVARAVGRHKPQKLLVTEPGEWRVLQMFRQWQQTLSCPVEVLPDRRFMASLQDFAAWAEGKKQLRMEFFYREMRRRYKILLTTEGEPEGGAWNYDHDNRNGPPGVLLVPPRLSFTPDETTQEVMALVGKVYAGHFGTLENFAWPVTRGEALQALDYFIDHLLPQFGPYQDAMVQGQSFMFHSLLSAAMNIGLLLPAEVVAAAEKSYRQGKVPLSSAEGFIRQILGWREYVRGLYWYKMPGYDQLNFFNHTRPLPDFYWGAPTDMNCVAQCVASTKANAYAHHIQRLMVTGNFALLAGLIPEEVCAWYLAVYVDAFEWVELPNTLGMALHADGGVMASKPYISSGQYIDRMSDYCQGCRYSVKEAHGDKACPFNYLYWNFLITHQDKLAKNPRLAMPYKNLARMSDEKKARYVQDAARFLASLKPAYAR